MSAPELSIWQQAVRREAAARRHLPPYVDNSDFNLRGAALLTRCLELLERRSWPGDRVAVMLAAELQRQEHDPAISSTVIASDHMGQPVYDIRVSVALPDGWVAYGMQRFTKPELRDERDKERAGRWVADIVSQVSRERVEAVVIPQLAEVEL